MLITKPNSAITTANSTITGKRSVIASTDSDVSANAELTEPTVDPTATAVRFKDFIAFFLRVYPAEAGII
tara:strand:- start:52 stop:261 length:210 start_codon:yes stop_codon:yes gene_type:complete